MTRAQLEKPAEYKQYEMELFFWNYKFAFGIFSRFKTSRIFRFLYTDLIDKIGMNSMVIETDMAEVCGIILRLGYYLRLG
jgi:hypothetical protein